MAVLHQRPLYGGGKQVTFAISFFLISLGLILLVFAAFAAYVCWEAVQERKAMKPRRSKEDPR